MCLLYCWPQGGAMRYMDRDFYVEGEKRVKSVASVFQEAFRSTF